MAAETDLFDLLRDELALEVLTRVPPPEYGGRPDNLAVTCRRLCRLARRYRRSVIRGPGKGVLLAAKAPADRAFLNIRRLQLEGGRTADVRKWALLQDAATAAAAAWPHLEEVELSGELTTRSSSCERGCWSGPLLALRAGAALRNLSLKLAESHSLVYLPALTQLTRLELYSDMDSECIIIPDSTCTRPLAGMPKLVSLKLHSMEVNGGLPCALPPQLTRLELEFCSNSSSSAGAGRWDLHIGQCQGLKELVLDSCHEADVDPTLLLQSLAPQLTGLSKLSFDRDEVPADEGENRLPNAIREMCNIAGIPQHEQDSWWPRPPLDGHDHTDLGPYVMVPPPNMGELTSLQHLSLSNWWLVVSSEVHWRPLGGCSSLRSLSGLHASVPPPAGIKFRHLTQLEVTASTSPGDTVTLLGAFPAVTELQLTVAPRHIRGEQAQPPAIRQLELKAVTKAGIRLLKPVGLPAAARAGCLAGYCSTLWGVLPGVEQLALEWPRRVQLLPHLPHASDLEQLSQLRLTSREHSDDSWEQQAVGVQQLVQMVQGATQLQQLDMCLDPAPGSTKDQLVLEVQQALPGLTKLGVVGGEKALEPGTLAVLRQGLSVTCAWIG